VATPSTLSATVPQGSTTSVNLALTDGSADCGYAYSVGTAAPWASIDPDLYSGQVSGSAATTIPVSLNAGKLKPGTYHGVVTVGSQNAEPNPVKVPLTLTVTSSSG
jgi:Viral BACON domain